MVFGELDAVYCDYNTKHLNALYCKGQSMLMLRSMVDIITTLM